MTKAKKKQLSDFNQRRKTEKAKKTLNPFEIHINKDKQNVLGRKSKVDRGLPGVSRAKAIKKRKGTLLQEFKQKHKDNLFLDKRIGEKNHTMSEEDKALARFAAERMKSHKKESIYNLNDDEQLTHRGQTLEEIEKFDDPKSDDEFSDDENRTGKLDRSFTDAHFGGGILSRPDAGKSRKDLIDQLIAESKKRKAEKQKIREQTMDLTEKLDTEWKDLLPIVSAANKKIEESTDAKKMDDYDVAVRQLKFEPRGTPSDKLKSEEDTVREEKAKLEALENDRIARMKGFVSDNNVITHKSADDLDDGFLKENINSTVEESDKSQGERDGEHSSDSDDDDTDGENDENDDDNEGGEGSGNEVSEPCEDNEEEDKNSNDAQDSDAEIPSNQTSKTTSAKNKDSDGESVDNAEVESEADDSEEEEYDYNIPNVQSSDSSSEEETTSPKKTVKFGTAEPQKPETPLQVKSILKKPKSLEKETPSDRQNAIREDLQKRKEIMEKARKELPYTYAVPESFEELQKLLEKQNPEYQSVIVDRIIKCNHWSLNGANKEKLADLFPHLLQHILAVAGRADSENIIECFNIIDRLVPYLYDLAHVNPIVTRNTFVHLLREEHEKFEMTKKIYPDLDTLIIFKLVSLLFPTSDYRHQVVTPSLIFMSRILSECRVRNRTDISKGLFVCTLILEYTALSKRFSPATINFLRGVIYLATPKHLVQGMKIIPPFKSNGKSSSLLVLDKQDINLKINPTNVYMRALDLATKELDDDFRLRALLTAINMLQEFKDNYDEIESSPSIFNPILKLLSANPFDGYNETVRTHFKEFQGELELLNEKKLEYMVGEKKKPKALRMYEPRIERVYDGKQHKPMSKERAEREKLLHKYKKEMKGAVREIRKDRAFLAKVQIKEQIKSDVERKRKVKEIFGEAAVQQSELKKFKRKK